MANHRMFRFMPIFEFDDHIDPVTIKIGNDTFEALPAIPADDFPKFMDVFRQIPPLVEKFSAEGSEDKLAAFEEFLTVSMSGLELVMTQTAIDAIRERAKSGSTNPIPATTLSAVFSKLAGSYMSGGKEAEDTDAPRPTEDGNASLPSSATTGGSSEANSFSGDATSDSGPTTT